ncbi:PH domain-containing protein [Flavobacterium sp.]|uniref:PH domain-containing protein n=1 Tax=Flavobacterium sp. TaxID=239 RepID=UPI002FDA5949
MKFKSSVHQLTGWVLVLSAGICFLSGVLILKLSVPETWIAFVLFTSVSLLCMWILLDTNYVLGTENLHYKTGPIRGKIAIQSIRSVEFVDSWAPPSFTKASLDKEGLYIKYNGFDDIFISPKDRHAFVNYLLTSNPNILIIKKE